ncbi:MAG: flagellar basal body-associated protein FliL [Gemmatimonadota bacterium]
MADEAQISGAALEMESDGEHDRKKGGVIPMLAAVALGLGGGGMLGSVFLGPSVGSAMAARAAHTQDEGGGGGHDGEGGDGAGEDAFHVIDNLVVNPAESSGMRFLLTTVAVEATDAGRTNDLAARDMELRDALLRVLGSKTVKELTDIEQRSAIVAEIRAAIEDVVGEGVVSRIYIPQFVIQ